MKKALIILLSVILIGQLNSVFSALGKSKHPIDIIDAEIGYEYTGPIPATSVNLLNTSNYTRLPWLTEALINIKCPGTGHLCAVVYPAHMTLQQALDLLDSFGFQNLVTDPHTIVDGSNLANYVRVYQKSE